MATSSLPRTGALRLSLMIAALLAGPVHAKRNGWEIPAIEEPPARYSMTGTYVIEFPRDVMRICPKERPSFACTVPVVINGNNIGVKIVMPRPSEARFRNDEYAAMVAYYLELIRPIERNQWIMRVRDGWILNWDEVGAMLPDPRLFPESCYARALAHEIAHKKGFQHGEGVMVACQK